MPEKLNVKSLYKVFGPEPQLAMNLLREGLDKDEIFERTGHTVGVYDASFSVDAGEIFVVMGLSGSGKSTLVRLLNRLIEPTAGEVWVGGQDIAKLSPKELMELRRRDMAMVFQSFALMPHMTVIDNAAFGLELAGVPVKDRHARAMEALDAVGLANRAAAYPSELSGGMQQRVGLARALANDPSVMLMDEAFSALDPLIRTEMQDELLKLQAEHERTVIFISHDLDEAMRIGDRIAIMEGGKVVQVGTPDEILNNPANEYVQSFFRGVDVSKVLTAGDVARREQVTVFDRPDQGARSAVQLLRDHDRDYGYVVDRSQRFQGVVSLDSLQTAMRSGTRGIHDALLPDVPRIQADTLLHEVFGTVAQTAYPVPVIGADGKYKGSISRAMILETLDAQTG